MLALAGDELSALIRRVLALEDQDTAATHARELRVRCKVLIDTCTELRPLRYSLQAACLDCEEQIL